MASAATAVRSRDHRWACCSAAPSLAMVGSFVLFGNAFGNGSRLAGKGGIFQRLSIAYRFGWLTALSLRALSAPGPATPSSSPTVGSPASISPTGGAP
ncbi:MAG: hypothetical protein ACRDZR_05545 [Acidimicrobiales bacterium]